ncbi:uncharacterized protein LOC26534919 [Drosophila yakuba]|uniref:uncharacterized protein LOC26534919 n=1 Tax=Drosophila yakuba TaxID=7245 RepID=UPI001930846B|nr:uncharacterized protein LOC26534919 [Drosophila yakuba]
MANSEPSKTPPPSLSESPNSNEFPPKTVRVNKNLYKKNTSETGFGRKIGENEQRVLDQWIESEGLNGSYNDREEWDSKEKVDSDAQKPQILDNEDVAVANFIIGIEEERAIKEWIKSEGLNEPHSDIEEFDMLLSLARDHEKNHDLLMELLKPKDLISQEKDVWKKFSPKVFKMPQKPDSVEPELWKPPPNEKVSVENIPEKEPQKATEFNQCSETIFQQLQLLIYEDSSNNPTAAEPEGIDFETEISKEQNSFTVRLEDFEYIIDQNMTEFRDPQAKRLRSKWNQQFGSKSLENLRRCLLLPPLSDHLDQCLQRIRILRRPNKRKVEELRMRVEMNFCKMYCTLSINMNLNLQHTVRNLRNAVYNDDIDVIQIRYDPDSLDLVRWQCFDIQWKRP